MKASKKRISPYEREKGRTQQLKASIEPAEGYGDKKLDGPNRPST